MASLSLSSPKARCATTDDMLDLGVHAAAYEKDKTTALPAASTCFSPAAGRHPPPQRAPDPDRRSSAQIPEPPRYPPSPSSLDRSRPPSPPVLAAATARNTFDAAEPDHEQSDDFLAYTAAAVCSLADSPFRRQGRDLPQALTTTKTAFTSSSSRPPPSPLRHVTAPRAWPPRRDSLNAPTTSGVR